MKFGSSSFLARVAAAALALWTIPTLTLHAENFTPQPTFHNDGRSTPSQDFVEQDSPRKHRSRGPKLASKTKVLEFLRRNAERYGLTPDLKDIELVGTQKSLLGTHYRFRQVLNGQEVISGEIVVTTNKEDDVARISNNIFPSNQSKTANFSPSIDQDKALGRAWDDLKVLEGAKMLDDPVVDLKLLPEKQSFRLVYDVRLSVSKPHGYWQYLIDAKTGEVVRKQNRASDLGNAPEVPPGNGRLANRDELLKQFKDVNGKARLRRRAAPAPAERMDGSALVFDPDPVSALRDATLTKDSPSDKFAKAYVERPLRGLTKRDGQVFLEGPYVRLTDFEDPVSPPATSRDGKWKAKRGDAAFNDVMTYYHIDRAQRHLQALGFSGLIERPIEVDANGVSGHDNSHHVPANDGRSGRLAFGHGCVADNEDAAVIWHEYAHAIHAEIVGSNWKGGDARAIGEGFGDYFAATMAAGPPGVEEYARDKVFRWDGTLPCWEGRSTNRQGIRYNPALSYRDHAPITGGVSDELWSTPLAQAMRVIVASGLPKDDADKIVIQGMFGLTSAGFTMHDLAQLTVLAAGTLYPDGPQGGIFLKQFQNYNICHPAVSDACAPPDAEEAVSKNLPSTADQPSDETLPAKTRP